jgi:hypothetical protein
MRGDWLMGGERIARRKQGMQRGGFVGDAKRCELRSTLYKGTRVMDSNVVVTSRPQV